MSDRCEYCYGCTCPGDCSGAHLAAKDRARADRAEAELATARSVALREAAGDIATRAVDAALSEVRRQGGPGYLLVEARNDGIGAALARVSALIGASESGGDTLGSLPCATCGGDHYTKRHDDVVGGGLASAGLSESGEGE